MISVIKNINRMRYFVLIAFLFSSNIFGQVNLQSGSAQYSIPLFSYSDKKSGLATDVQLSYSSGYGLIVNNIPSCVGQNWNLIAGGYIVRRQSGEPDDQNSTALFPTIANGNVRGFNCEDAFYDEDYQSFQWGGDPYSRDYVNHYYPNGYMYSEFPLDMTDDYPLKNNVPRELAFFPRFKNNMDKNYKLSRRALADREQDVYVYNFNGVSGEFVIGKDGTPLMINDSKMKVEKTTQNMSTSYPAIRTRINSFTIKDIDGTVYKFSNYELSQVMKVITTRTEGPDQFKKIVTTSIPTSYINGGVEPYQYTIQKWLLTEITNPFTQEKITFEYEDYDIDFITDRIPSYQFTEGSQAIESVEIYEQRSIGKLKRLKKILLPDGHKVDFFYAAKSRIDLPGDYPITKIKVSYNDETISAYNLVYGYFFRKEIIDYSSTVVWTEQRFARLCLKSIQKTGAKVAQPPYKFEYYTGAENTDPKDIVPSLDCIAQDHWGFYNKVSLVDNEVTDPSKEVLKDLMLNNQTYRQPSPGAAKLGLLKSVQNPFGGKLTFEYEQNDSKDADNPSITKITGGVRVFKTTLSDGVNTSNDIVTTYTYKLSDGTTSGWGYETPVYLNRRQIKIYKDVNGYDHGGYMVHDVTTAIAKIIVKEIAKQLVKTVVKTIATKAAIASAPEPVVAITVIIIGGLIDRMFVLFDPTDYVWSDVYKFYPFQNQNSLGVNYSRVEIKNTSLAGGMGKTVEEFTAPANVRTEIPAFTMPYSSKQRFPAWKYGLPWKTFIYNETGSLIKELTNNYTVYANSANSDNYKSCKVEVIRPESSWCGDASGNLPLSDFSWEFYYPLTGRAELTSSVIKEYSASGILAQTQLSNTYNTDYLLKNVTTTKSNGDQFVTKNYYTNDYDNISTAIQDMKTNNMVGVPISTETWLAATGNEDKLVDATVNEFTKLADGEIKLGKVYKLESSIPINKSTIGDQTSSSLIRNTSYFKEQTNITYNSSGLPVQVASTAGSLSSTIFDYSNRLPIATVSNASSNEIAYSSFEADGKGNWQFDDATNNYSTVESITGYKSYKLNNGTASNTITNNNLNSSKTYIVSYWGKNGSVTVNGSSGTSVFSANGWNLYIHEISGISSVSVSGTALIDELRLYPKKALMNTITYQPSFGKTSECDANNRITYYEYDDFGRLRIIRDANKNVIKMYEYNYKR
jgi:YD repeat-containing protein